MKKLLLFIFTIFYVVAYTQTPTSILKVPSATTAFGIPMSSTSLVLDTTTKTLWILSNKANKTNTLSTSSKYTMGGYTSGTGITISNNTISSAFWKNTTSNLYVNTPTYKTLGIGSTNPLHQFVVVSARSTSPAAVGFNIPVFNFVNSDINTNRTAVDLADDTSSFHMGFTYYTGKPYLRLRGNTGTSVMYVDTNGTTTFSNYSATKLQGISVSTFTPSCGWLLQYEQSATEWQMKPFYNYVEEFMNVQSNLPVPNTNNLQYPFNSGSASVTYADGDIFGRLGIGISGSNTGMGIGTTNIAAGTGNTLLAFSNNHSYTNQVTGLQISSLSTSTYRYKLWVGMLGGMTNATTTPSSGAYLCYEDNVSANWIARLRWNGTDIASYVSSVPVEINKYYNIAETFTNYNNTQIASWYVGVGTSNPGSAPSALSTASFLISTTVSNISTTGVAPKFGWGVMMGRSLGTAIQNISFDGLKQHVE